MKKLFTIAFTLLLLSAGAQEMQFPDSLKNAWYRDFELITEDDNPLLKCINRKAKECEQSWACYVYCLVALPVCISKWTYECFLSK